MAAPRSLLDCFQGCLLGVALGDALGLPVEGFTHAQCATYVQDVTARWKAAGADDADEAWIPVYKNPELDTVGAWGQYSDDTQMTRELATAVVSRARFSPPVFAERMLRLFSRKALCGAGSTTRAALRRFAAGAHWSRLAGGNGRPSNGSAMRASPVGLWCYADLAAVARMSCHQSIITHSHTKCQAGAAIAATSVALCVQMATEGTPLTQPAAFLDTVMKHCRHVDGSDDVGAVVKAMLATASPEEAIKLVPQPPADYKTSTRSWPIGTYVTGTVAWALYCFLKSPNDYWATIMDAIAVGGDVDTTAAIAGAMAGAYNGWARMQRAPWCDALTSRLRDEYTMAAFGRAHSGTDLLLLARQMHDTLVAKPQVKRKRLTLLASVAVCGAAVAVAVAMR